MSDYVIQAIRVQDIQEILKIENESFLLPWTRGMFLGELSNPLSKALVVRSWDDTDILGYLFYQIVVFEMHILNLAVHPSFRSMGIGRALLLNSLKREKRKASVKCAYLEVRENNVRAIQLYTKSGFKQIGLRKKYYARDGGNALVMEKCFD